MADATDEHLSLVRIADCENFDVITLQAGITKSLARIFNHPTKPGIYHEIFPIPDLPFNLHPRFVDSIRYLFTEGHVWKLHGTYTAMTLHLGH